jgi:hypothetical protein
MSAQRFALWLIGHKWPIHFCLIGHIWPIHDFISRCKDTTILGDMQINLQNKREKEIIAANMRQKCKIIRS